MTEPTDPVDLDLLASLALDALDVADEVALLDELAGRPELVDELATLRNGRRGSVRSRPRRRPVSFVRR